MDEPNRQIKHPPTVQYESAADAVDVPNQSAQVCLWSALVAIMGILFICGGIKFARAVLGNWGWYLIAAASLIGIIAGVKGEFNARHGAGFRDYATLGLWICLILGALALYFIYWD